MEIEIKEHKTGVFEVFIDGINFGVIDHVDGLLCFFPKRSEKLTGDHYILIGQKLNEMNMVSK